MPPRRRTPVINRLQNQGMSRWEILDRMNGANDNKTQFSRAQYRAMGFDDWRIDRFMAGEAAWQQSGPSGGAGGGPSAPAGPTGPAPIDSFDQYLQRQQEQQEASAYSLMRGLLEQYGLGSLAGELRNIIEGGVTDQPSIQLALQETDAWKQRFIGNERLRSAGLPVLSVAEYLATERSYAQIMKNYGLPQGFYDDPADFGDFIGKGVSAAELQERVQAYSDLANREDPAVKAELAARGMSTGDLMAFMMDPERANPIIQRKYKSTLIGAAARRTGMTTDQAYADRLAGMGITEEQAQAGYAVISENLGAVDRLGEIYGTDYDQRDFESEVFEGDGAATRKRKRLASQERAAFSGSSGVTQGSLRQSSAGQY